MKNRKKAIALSAIAIFMLGSSAYAGKIITDANVSDIAVLPDTQFGFGGWNYENVDVRIVNVADFSTPTLGTFDTETGEYTGMDIDMSFESDIKDITYDPEGNIVGTTVMGHLHGKDWPVGEPSGIKIINGDDKTSHGKPENCIMTTSYQEGGYLDVADVTSDATPVICSSPWQTHKRYKINLLPTTVEGVEPGTYGKPVDLLFNLDPADLTEGITRYQVLQKANNYTGMRLDGYKVEVLDENGTVNDALTLSLGIGEGEDDLGAPDPTVDIWGEEDMANMSHGLWGPYEEGRFNNGFFDFKTAYYDVNLTDNNHTISYVGDMLGGNYQELFGNWLPSIWEPMGIFHDDDQNPETDGALKAFLGVAPGYDERAWYKSVIIFDPTTPKVDPVYTWEAATAADLAEWQGEWYEEGPVEDVLNLGLNYIINIGANADIGATFTLRITPHVAMDQTPPSSYNPNYMSSKYNFETSANFNDDNIADILWKDTSTGDIVIWYMNSDGTHVEEDISASNLDYTIEASANFNDDNIADILWKDYSTGAIMIWYMNSDGTHVEKDIFTSNLDYSVEAAANFNEDAIADILFRNRSTGRVGIEYMNSVGTSSWKFVLKSNVNYSIEAAANFNDEDAIADILFRNRSTGRVGIQYMKNDGTSSWKFILTSNVDYSVETVANFNDDGIADILFRNRSTGRTGIQYVNNDGTTNWTFIDSSLGIDYNVETASIFNDDTIDDILWRNPSIGDNIIRYMNSDGTHN